MDELTGKTPLKPAVKDLRREKRVFVAYCVRCGRMGGTLRHFKTSEPGTWYIHDQRATPCEQREGGRHG